MLGDAREGDLFMTTPFHLDGQDMYTWYNSESTFTPGRLDYILIGGDLEQSDAFVLDTSDLDGRDKNMASTREASDHLPVVVDVTFSP